MTLLKDNREVKDQELAFTHGAFSREHDRAFNRYSLAVARACIAPP